MKNSPSADSVVSDIFKMPRGSVFSTMCILYGRAWIAASVLIFIAGIALFAFTSDLRWLILSLLLLFIVFPMVAVFLYFSHGLRRECFLNAVEHDVAISPDGVRVRLYRPEYDSDGKTEEEAQDAQTDRLSLSSEFILPFSAMRPFITSASSVTIPVDKGFLWLPLSAFSGMDQFSAFTNEIGERMAESRSRGLPWNA